MTCIFRTVGNMLIIRAKAKIWMAELILSLIYSGLRPQERVYINTASRGRGYSQRGSPTNIRLLALHTICNIVSYAGISIQSAVTLA